LDDSGEYRRRGGGGTGRGDSRCSGEVIQGIGEDGAHWRRVLYGGEIQLARNGGDGAVLWSSVVSNGMGSFTERHQRWP
jgi:hypothetical protein